MTSLNTQIAGFVQDVVSAMGITLSINVEETDEGTRIKKGQVLCIVEAMKLMNEIEAEIDGTIVQCLVESGRPVLPVLTKADKLTRSALPQRERELAGSLGLRPENIQLVSSRSSQGIGELASSILAAARRVHAW